MIFRTTIRRAAAGLAVALLAAPAAVPAEAQDRPRLEAGRDFNATYRLMGNENQRMSMSWRAADRTLRVDMGGGPLGTGYLLHDRRTGSARMVLPEQRMVMTLPMDMASAQGIPIEPSANARFVREGTETVAGLRCTNWRIEDGAHRGTACLTDDGIMLRARGEADGRSGGLEAVEVSVVPQDAARFQVPAGFQTMQMPAGLPGMPRR